MELNTDVQVKAAQLQSKEQLQVVKKAELVQLITLVTLSWPEQFVSTITTCNLQKFRRKSVCSHLQGSQQQRCRNTLFGEEQEILH